MSYRILYCLFALFGCILQTNANDFRAAVAKVDITPDDPQMLLGYHARKSTGVNDKIYHRIIVMDDGSSKFILVSSDLCLISPSEYDKFAAKLKSKFNIDKKNLWWTATHTHSAPEFGPAGLPGVFMGERYEHHYDKKYADLVADRLMEGITKAISLLQPAQLGIGWGFSKANINRRAHTPEGKCVLGMNPDAPVDRKIGLLKIVGTNGSLIAQVANYAIHGTVLGSGNLLISADGPGIVAEYVEEKTGAPLLFVNGAAGNMAPIYSGNSHPAEHMSEFKLLLGDKILEASQRIASFEKEVKFNTSLLVVETPRKKNLGWPNDLGNYTRTTKAGVHLVRIPVSFLKINNDIALWGAPLELFCEISNKIRDNSPFGRTMYFGYCNGWLGYMPDTSEIPFGGYEVEMVSPYTPQGPIDLYEAVIGHLQTGLRQ